MHTVDPWTVHTAPTRSVTTSYLCGPGFPGASPCLKRRACIQIREVNRDLRAPAHRHLVVTGSAQLHVEVAPRTGGAPPACCPIHSSGSGRAASLGIAPIPSAKCCHSRGHNDGDAPSGCWGSKGRLPKFRCRSIARGEGRYSPRWRRWPDRATHCGPALGFVLWRHLQP